MIACSLAWLDSRWNDDELTMVRTGQEIDEDSREVVAEL